MFTLLSRRRRSAITAAVLGATLVLACLAPNRAGSPVSFQVTAAEGPSYISLGDSLAAGSQPDADGNDGPTSQGYADVLGQRLAKTYPGLATVKVSCGGVTTWTMINGGASCQPKGEPSQLVRAERYLKAHRNVPLVTVDVGDNDVEGCISVNPPSVDAACVAAGRQRIARNLPTIAKRLRAAAGPHTAVVGITDYNQFLALWNDGAAGRGVARRSMHIIRSLNTLMKSVYRANGILVAEAGDRFASDDLTTMRTLPRFGRVPLAVARICQWTWACSDPPIGHDDHAKPHGYQVIAESVLDRLAHPDGS